MSRTLVVLDPRPGFSKRLEAELTALFDVIRVVQLDEAMRLIGEPGTIGVAASMLQLTDENGLELCEALRQASAEPASLVVMVYGAGVAVPDAKAMAEIERKFGVDLLVPGKVDPPELGGLIVEALRRRLARDRAQQPREEGHVGAVQEGVIGARVQRDVRDDRWSELLHRDVNAESFGELLTRPIGREPIEEPFSEDYEPTWSELLQAKATPENLRRMMTKKVTGKESKD